MSWYAVLCRAGQENTLINSFRKHLSKQVIEEVFQFSYEREKKYLGKWHVDSYPLFPSYIFLQSKKPELLLKDLEPYRNIVEVLENGGLLLPVKQEEERILRELCGDTHHMSMSRATIEDGRLKVIDGPLAGKERWVRKIDKHKRIAVLNLRMMLREREIWAGLEITSKERRTEIQGSIQEGHKN